LRNLSITAMETLMNQTLNIDGVVDVSDLLILLGNWG